MANFAPKADASKAKGSLATNNAEHQAPPVLHLEAHHIEKLFKGKMPPVGSKVKISGLAHVGATSEHDHGAEPGEKGGGKRRSMTLHMHQMDAGTGPQPGVKDADQEAESAKGAKAEMDKALAREAGGGKVKKRGKDSEGEEGNLGRGDSTPRGSNGPGGLS